MNESALGVVPVLVGPLQALVALLPALLTAVGGALVALFKPSAIHRLLQILWAQKGAVVLLIAAAAGLIVGTRIAFPSRKDAVAAAERGGAGWVMWRGGPARRGAFPGPEADPAHGNVVWRFETPEAKTFYSSPTVVGNRVYATSARYEYFSDVGGVYSLDADTGKVVWAFTADGYRSTFSSPSVSGKYLVVGEGLHETRDARVFCLDVEAGERERRGVKLWSYRTRSHVESSACVADGKAFIGAGDDGLYCFALEPDATGQARVLWHLSGERYPDCETSPVAADGKVYFGLGNGGQAVCCVDAVTGRELWRTETPYPVFASPTLGDDRLYVGMGWGDFVNEAEAVAANLRKRLADEGRSPDEIERAVAPIRPVGEVWCLDPATGARLWSFKTGRTVLGTVAAAEGRVYFGSRDGHVYAVTREGDAAGKVEAHGSVTTSPAVGRDFVYVVTETGTLVGLNRRSLVPEWKVSLNSPSFSSPAVARGHVYVGSTQNGLLCVGRPGREKREALWAGALGGNGASGWVDGGVLPSGGVYAWAGYADRESGSPKPIATKAPAAVVKGALYLGTDEGLARLDGAETWGVRTAWRWLARSTNPVRRSAAGTESAVYFVDGAPGDEGRRLRCVDPANGQERWSRPVESSAEGEILLTPPRLWIADEKECVTCLDVSDPRSSREVWRAKVGAARGATLLRGELLFVALASPAGVAALDRETGASVWRIPLPAAPGAGPVYAGDRVWVAGEFGLRALSPVQGEESLEIECSPLHGRLSSNGEVVAFVDGEGDVRVVDARDGSPVALAKGADPASSLLMADRAILYFARGEIRRLDVASGQATRWAKTAWLGEPCSAMVSVDSHVMFATDQRGFLCLKPGPR